MIDTLVDTNVLLDITAQDPIWNDWSRSQLIEAANEGRLVVNPIVYSEMAAGYTSREDLDLMLAAGSFSRETLPWDAAFMAGVVHLAYRKRGGQRTSLLPDFLIGAHAAVCGYRLLTRDKGYYSSYFPTLDIISPEHAP